MSVPKAPYLDKLLASRMRDLAIESNLDKEFKDERGKINVRQTPSHMKYPKQSLSKIVELQLRDEKIEAEIGRVIKNEILTEMGLIQPTQSVQLTNDVAEQQQNELANMGSNLNADEYQQPQLVNPEDDETIQELRANLAEAKTYEKQYHDEINKYVRKIDEIRNKGVPTRIDTYKIHGYRTQIEILNEDLKQLEIEMRQIEQEIEQRINEINQDNNQTVGEYRDKLNKVNAEMGVATNKMSNESNEDYLKRIEGAVNDRVFKKNVQKAEDYFNEKVLEKLRKLNLQSSHVDAIFAGFENKPEKEKEFLATYPKFSKEFIDLFGKQPYNVSPKMFDDFYIKFREKNYDRKPLTFNIDNFNNADMNVAVGNLPVPLQEFTRTGFPTPNVFNAYSSDRKYASVDGMYQFFLAHSTDEQRTNFSNFIQANIENRPPLEEYEFELNGRLQHVIRYRATPNGRYRPDLPSPVSIDIYNKLCQLVFNTHAILLDHVDEYAVAQNERNRLQLRPRNQDGMGFREFRNQKINYEKLMKNNKLDLRNKSGSNIKNFPTVLVSDLFRNHVLKLLDGDKLDEDEIEELDPIEKKLMGKLLHITGIGAYKSYDTLKKMEEKLKLIQDEIEAGNDSHLLLEEAKEILDSFAKQNKISKQEAKRFYDELANYNN